MLLPWKITSVDASKGELPGLMSQAFAGSSAFPCQASLILYQKAVPCKPTQATPQCPASL